MQHRIPVDALGADGPRMALAVSSCVHCGFCLPACPTYRVLGEEMDSPRGRIVLMKGALEGDIDLDEAAVHLDRCLGCLGCETACPSGVRYRDLIEPFKAKVAARRAWWRRAYLAALLRLMASPSLFRPAVRAGTLVRRWMPTSPAALGAMLSLLPARVPPATTPPEFTAATGARRGRVALMTGCVQSVLRPGITAAAVRVLTDNGVEVVVPPAQGCCGALAQHSGARGQGNALAAAHAARFPRDVDAILSTAAGCGSAMKDHRAEHPDGGPPVLDVAEYLDRLGLRGSPRLPSPVRVAYQDACHLTHAQQVVAAPRRLLQRIDGLTLVGLTEPDLCCGSAGLYNIEQPALAAELGGRKADAVGAAGVAMVVTGNIGCMTQLQTVLASRAVPVAVHHTVEVLDMAYRHARESQ